ncbi:T9SS type B sorting domain-containing protein [Psychroflexus planctonicus]|uniref:Gliding motility-associated C-terminal domain-containing protein n=1 Tax=Psychroflexus planctonicus TaxID=1526575 RepID=A0ABQ1SD01_9FLAO|nr:T9SS type B sorting domain-containing protein [Psychroflexus planctonicus]GGE29598.1 hypothetical protein GCM10010832_07670 [Psychroflexus planctonicus]
MLFSQGEANNWYFGQFAGVNFDTNPPTALTDGQLSTIEGCSTISDSSGKLLFYTDGRTVWDREHNIMPNADYFGGTGLLGDPSSTTSALIVPFPNQPDLYFIFTVDEPHHQNANAQPNQGPADENGFPLQVYDQRPGATVPEVDDGYNNGVNYSIVDMTLRNGLGDVVENNKNNHLITYDESKPEQIKYKSSEKLTAVAGPDCNSIWVISHFVDSYYAFLIDEDGINEEPIISKVPPQIGLDFYGGNASGYLKASPDAEKLLIANTQTVPPLAISGNVYLYDFDKLTGQVSNPLVLADAVRPYGIEFSPDSKKAFATMSNNLYQWDLEADNISESEFILNMGTFQAALQFGPDGKIYISGGSDLNVINNPTEYGENIDFTNSILSGAIDLEGNGTAQGLPAFVQSIFNSRVDIINGEEQSGDFKIETVISVCDGVSYTLGFEYESGATYQWYENGEILPGETNPFLEISLPPDEEAPFSTAYTLDIFPDSDECKLSGLANAIFGEKPTLNDATLSQCSSGFAFFNLERAREDLVMSTGLEAEDFEFEFYENTEELINNNPIQNRTSFQNNSNHQNILVEVTSKETRCKNTANVQLEVIDDEIEETIEVELTECDTNLDGFQEFNLELAAELTSFTPTNFYTKIKDALEDRDRITNTTEFSNTEAYSQTIYFRTLINGSCSVLGVLNLRVNDLPFLFEDKEVFYCVEDSPEPITIAPSVPENAIDDYEYFWTASNVEAYSIEVNQPAIYQVLVAEKATGCEAIQNIAVKNTSTASFQVNINDGSETSNSIEIIVDQIDNLANYEYALNNPSGPYQDSPNFYNLSPDVYEVFVRNKYRCGIAKRTIKIVGAMQFFTPNNDGINDVWNLVGLANNQNANVQVFDRFGKLLVEFKARGNPGWDGTYNGKLMPNNDYWYQAKLDDGRILTGNFTLKR